MRCPTCGAEAKKEWTYCSKCGARLKDIFEDVFSKMMKDIAATQKQMERQFEVFDITPMFRLPKIQKGKGVSRGFSIQIKTATGQQPKVSIKSWGWPKEALEKEVEAQLGELGLKKVSGPSEKPKVEIKSQKMLPVPKVTEEPKTEIRRIGNKVVVDMELPDVKSESDIRITELEHSVEVKAMAGEKAYFKIITKPAEFRLSGKKFSKGCLHLEFE